MCMPSLPRSCFDGLILSCMAPGCNCSELCFFSMDTRRIRWRLLRFAIEIFKHYLTRFALSHASPTCFKVRAVSIRAHAHDANFTAAQRDSTLVRHTPKKMQAYWKKREQQAGRARQRCALKRDDA